MVSNNEEDSKLTRFGDGEGLRLASSEAVSSNSFLEGSVAEPRLVDMTVDSSQSLELARRRTIVYVDARLPAEVIVHRGVRQFVKAHLAGRNAICFEESGLLRTGFAVEDHSPETMSKVAIFAEQVGKLLCSNDVIVYPGILPGTPGEKFTL